LFQNQNGPAGRFENFVAEGLTDWDEKDPSSLPCLLNRRQGECNMKRLILGLNEVSGSTTNPN
jgi:hypothetical protein